MLITIPAQVVSKYNITDHRIQRKFWWCKCELMTCFFGDGCPVANSMSGYVSKYLHILFCSPKTPFHIGFVTARRPPHCELKTCHKATNDHFRKYNKLDQTNTQNPDSKRALYDAKGCDMVMAIQTFSIYSGSEVKTQGRRWRFKRMMSEEARKAWEMFPFNYNGMINIIFLQTVWGATRNWSDLSSLSSHTAIACLIGNESGC